MLSDLKVYFGITDTSHDDILNLIIDQDEAIVDALGIDEALLFSMCVEDYSLWLKSGNDAFKVSQASDGINRYSADLYSLIQSSRKVVVF